jgi:lysozyme
MSIRATFRRTGVADQRLSEKGRDFLVREEGVVRYAYNDPAGHATFGVGHLLHRGRVTEADKRRWGTRARPKPMSLVYEVLADDLEKFEEAVRETVGRRMWQHRFDACVSLAFNIGTGGFRSSTVARELQAQRSGFSQRAADAFLLWANPRILRPRRERERRLFLEGSYGVSRRGILTPQHIKPEGELNGST